MSMIDEQGRLFGRVNIVDASVVLFLVFLIPLAYGTALLFRPARPRVDSVQRVDITNEERRIVGGGSLLTAKLKVKGTALNPMLRASIGGVPALAFVFENPNSADVLVGQVPPGSHDLVLFDGVQEVARAKGAVVIDTPSTRVVRAEGWLTNLDPAVANELKVGIVVSTRLEVSRSGRDWPGAAGAVAHAFCRTERGHAHRGPGRAACRHPHPLRSTGRRLPHGPGTVHGGRPARARPATDVRGDAGPVAIGFSIEELFPTTPPRRARVRVALDAGADTAGVRAGDRDALLDGRAAVVSSVQGRSVTLDLGLDDSRDGWRYRGHVVRPGASFSFETDRYEASGRVESVTLSAAPAADAK